MQMEKIKPWLQIIRLPNLLILALSYLFFYQFILRPTALSFNANGLVNYLQLALIIISSVLIAAAGYITNDVNDLETDKLNRKTNAVSLKMIPQETAESVYNYLNFAAVAISFLLGYLFHNFQVVAFFVLPLILLWLYSLKLKSTVLLGNICIAFLCAFPFLLMFYVNRSAIENEQIQKIFVTYTIAYTVFAFLVNLLREIIKDMEDYQGDLETGIFTLPVKMGVRAAKLVSLFLYLILFGIYVWLSISYYKIHSPIPALYVIIGLMGSIGASLYFLLKNKYAKSSFWLKIHLSIGILSMLLIAYYF